MTRDEVRDLHERLAAATADATHWRTIAERQGSVIADGKAARADAVRMAELVVKAHPADDHPCCITLNGRTCVGDEARAVLDRWGTQ